MNLCDVKRGDTISFIYWGGSNPGSNRHMIVSEIKTMSFIGPDIDDRNQIKTFLTSKMRHVQLFDLDKTAYNKDEVIKLITASLPECDNNTLLSLFEQAEKNGEETFSYEEGADLFYIADAEKSPYFLLEDGDIIIVNRDGQKLYMSMTTNSKNIPTLYCKQEVIDMQYYPTTPIDLVRKLTTHLGYTE